jgi:hypothetical protein
MIMKSTIFWDVTPCGPVGVHRYLRGMFSLCWLPASFWFHTLLAPTSCWLLVWLTLQPWKWRQYISLKSQWTSTSLCSIISHKIVLKKFVLYVKEVLILNHYGPKWKFMLRPFLVKSTEVTTQPTQNWINFCDIIVSVEVSIPAKFYCSVATRFWRGDIQNCQKNCFGA